MILNQKTNLLFRSFANFFNRNSILFAGNVITITAAGIIVFFSFCSCNQKVSEKQISGQYFQDTDLVQTGGIQVIPIATAAGKFNIWTKKIGNNPKIKVLILSGGPGISHEYLECFESFLPREGFELIYYDQLGTGNSEVPKTNAVYSLERSVDEVEQVRIALGLNKENFYLFGHSWGGILAIEYALKYQKQLKALIISDMMASAADYNAYAENVLSKHIAPKVLNELRTIESRQDFNNPRYMKLLQPNFYAKFICRLPTWPEPLNRALSKLNQNFYTIMQGPSEFGLRGKLTRWDRKADLKKITVPTLTIGARYDTMDPKEMAWMARQVQHGEYLYCPNGSHMSMYDDQKAYFKGLLKFIHQVSNRKN